MLNTLAFGSYCTALAAMCYNLHKAKEQDDFEREIKEYREYDFEHETIRNIKDNETQKAIVLAKYRHESNQEVE